MKKKTAKTCKLTPAEEIRQIKHWLVDRDMEWEEGPWRFPWEPELHGARVTIRKPRQERYIYGDGFKTKLAAWRDVKRRVEGSIQEGQ